MSISYLTGPILTNSQTLHADNQEYKAQNKELQEELFLDEIKSLINKQDQLII
jgi:hypothetical protein